MTAATDAEPDQPADFRGLSMAVVVGDKILSKVIWRLLPFVMLLGVVHQYDRINISFAALQMNKDLGLTATAYGFGAGLFSLTTFFLEVPSNYVQLRVGTRRWFARIMITWGLAAMAMSLITGPYSFYLMRFLLGAAEAGFLGGAMFYFRGWLPAGIRGKVLGTFASYSLIAFFSGAPLSTAIMTAFDGAFGLHGWQVMYIIEGAPAVLLAFVVFYYLPDKPADATWLTTEEQQWLTQTLEAEHAAQGARGVESFWHALIDPRVLLVALLCFFLLVTNFGLSFWLPQIIKSFGKLTNNEVGWLSAVPYLLAMPLMFLWGRHSDRSGERRWHLIGGYLVSALGFVIAALAATPQIIFIGICIGCMGLYSTFGVFWALPSDFLKGGAAAAGLAVANSGGALGGFAGPYLMGFLRDRTQGFEASLLVLAGAGICAALVSACLRNTRRHTGDVAIAAATPSSP
jgi:MFS transporter, ACS family, tartrate transporter